MKPFDWVNIGDISVGRKNLGNEMPVAIYRLMQFTIKEVLDDKFGQEQADAIFHDAGYRAGEAFAHKFLDLSQDFSGFVAELQKRLKELKIGIVRIESADLEKLEIVLTVDEDLDCSGLPVFGDTVCIYDEGLLEGILFAYTGKQFDVKEVDCWATGDRTCRFKAVAR